MTASNLPQDPDSNQGDLFAQWPAWSPDSPAGKFESYHQANPQVFETLVREARRWMRERPGQKIGINLLVGRVRWVLTLKTQTDADGFKINDHFAPYYSRLMVHRHPEFADLFDLRRSFNADAWLDDLKAREGREGRAA